MAQLVARPLWEREVVGSSPATPTSEEKRELPQALSFFFPSEEGVRESEATEHPDVKSSYHFSSEDEVEACRRQANAPTLSPRKDTL